MYTPEALITFIIWILIVVAAVSAFYGVMLRIQKRRSAKKAWDEGAKVGYKYGREDEVFSVAYAVPTNNPYEGR